MPAKSGLATILVLLKEAAVPKRSNVLGIDIGSVAIAAAEITAKGRLVKTAYCCHLGDVDQTLKKILGAFNPGRMAVAATTSTPSTFKVARRYDNRVASIAAVRRFYPQVRSILIIGGEKFGLIQFDQHGDYRTFRSNTSCAAGTGGFLDQQASRLRLESTAALSTLALKNTGHVPQIASRCAVFAKTDLAHAQQQGYLLEQICDGLCYGLAKNVVDVLFSGQKPLGPVLFTGGVANNSAVAGHIRPMIGTDLMVDTMPCGAVGAALCLLDEGLIDQISPLTCVDELFLPKSFEKTFGHDPIELTLSEYPSFTGSDAQQVSYEDECFDPSNPVEVDIYADIGRWDEQGVYLGIDIGSTSSKAVLLADHSRVLAGFYTRTAGRPVHAMQNLMASIHRIYQKNSLTPTIIGVAATGSGRKFTGAIVGADLILNEITAHARAAVELNPTVDTIIEIGGQDAKFTSLQNGQVTFAAMNAVCAAGTGSFIEEQAQKLGCPLDDIAARTEHRRSPLASDRCTVFMERDINHYLSQGYTVDEVLAAVLHSVVENYLNKVAIENTIGTTIAFQGAPAKNRSLVAALEQRLQKPIFVSRYCHLTGAMGAALALADQFKANGHRAHTEFKGLDIYKNPIPITSETCQLCTNHCKITVARVGLEKVAFGFLCGRDYQTPKRINHNRSGFDLLRARKKAYYMPKPEKYGRDITMGLPAGLHLIEDLPLWQKFFDELGIRTLTSAACTSAVKEGKPLAGAEFCAPMMALYGHVHYLLEQADHIFLPFYLEKKHPRKDWRRQYCYYTQFVPSVTAALEKPSSTRKILSPLVHYLYKDFFAKVELYRTLNTHAGLGISFFNISAAYDTALKFKQMAREQLKTIYQRHLQTGIDPHVVLLGRPYTVLVPSMNKGILDIFAALGIKTFYQDMLSYSHEDVRAIEPLLAEVNWHYAAKTLEAAEVVASTPGAYPVLVTAFKCTPDSFVIDYFKKVMAAHNKPFLILQLDEHDSNVGYETRIEAAIASFNNHHMAKARKTAPRYAASLSPTHTENLSEKTLVFPNWDPMSLRLVVANLQKEGYDARLLQDSDTTLRKSMRLNSGQCTPLSIIAQEFMDYIETHELDPGQTVLWVCSAKIPCNIGLYPLHIQSILNAHGMQDARVYAGRLSLADISLKLPVNTYFAYMFGGFLKKMGCRIRPYERVPGTTDRIMRKSMQLLEGAFRWRRSKESALARVIEWFESIERHDPDPAHPRPKVAIFGDLYARDNEMINQDLIHFIEAHGGEVVTTPYSTYLKMIVQPYLRKWFVEGRYLETLTTKALITTISHLEKTYLKYFHRILNEPEPTYDESPQQILAAYGLRIENSGESMENILKIYYLKKHYPDIALFVQTTPAFCCPSLITEAMVATIEKKTQTPVASITYDGTGGNNNEVIIPYLKFPRQHWATDQVEGKAGQI